MGVFQAVVIFWIWVSWIAGKASNAGIGFSLFFAPIVGIITFVYTDKALWSLAAGFGPLAILLVKNASDKEEEERRQAWEKLRHAHGEEKRKLEIEQALFYLSGMTDKEAIDIRIDYARYYITGKMRPDIVKMFEDKLLKKTKKMRDAEERKMARKEVKRQEKEGKKQETERRKQQLERKQLEKDQERLKAKYGQN